MSKSTALIVGLSIITVFGFLSFWKPDNAVHLGAILGAVVTLVSAFIGLQVVNNGVRGKNFNEGVARVDAEKRKGE